MQLLLSVPFRTRLTLHTRFVVARPPALLEVLRRVAAQLSGEYTQLRIETLDRHDEDRVGLYTSIDEDVLLPSVLPLFSIAWDLVARPGPEPGSPAGMGPATATRAVVHVFDQTLAILELALELPEPDDADRVAETLDKWSFAHALSWLEVVQPIVTTLESRLVQASLGDRSPVASPPREDGAYFDRLRVQGTDAKAAMLWVSRVLVLEAAPAAMQWLRNWTQDRLSPNERIAIGADGAALRVGNSVVFGPWDEVAESALTRALRLCNRFYAIAHVLGANQRILHGLVMADAVPVARASTISQTVRSRFEFLRHEYEDALLGVQGLRRLAVEAYMQAWDFDKLLGSCERRLQAVDQILQAALQKRNLRYTRLVEVSLTLIGGLTMMDFAVNLMNFARAQGVAVDHIPGLVDFARVVPEDGLLYALLAIIFMIVYTKFRQR